MSQPTVLCKGCKNAGLDIKSSLLFVLCLHLEIPAKIKCFLKLALCVHTGRHENCLRSWVSSSGVNTGERLLSALNMYCCITTLEAWMVAVKWNSVFTYTVKMEDIHQSWGLPYMSWWSSGLRTALKKKKKIKKSLIGYSIELPELKINITNKELNT